MTSRGHTPLCVMAILAFCAVALGGQTGKPAVPAKQKPLPTLSAQEIFKRVSPSVMVVESLDASGKVTTLGSGVVIAPGHVVTNRHVIEDGVSFRVVHNNKKWPAKLIKVDPDHDLAELSVVGFDALAVTVLGSSKLVVGETVYAIGAPEGLELTISEGLISGLRDFDKGRVIQTSAAISPGSSGGGLFDAQGRLVGITTFYLKEGQSLNFALPVEWTLALDRRPAETSLVPTRKSAIYQALVWFELGSFSFNAEKFAAAANAFNQAVRLKPDDGPAWVMMGEAFFQLRQWEKAANALREAVKLNPDLELAWVSLGIAWGRLGRYDKSVMAAQQAIRLKPRDETAWATLAIAYEQLGQYDKAVSANKEAVSLKPDDALDWYSLGLDFKAEARESEVIKVYEKLKRLDPRLADKFFRQVVLP